MKLTFSLILTFLLAFLLGCSTENPLCTDNYCVTGEIFLRSQLLEDEAFSEIAVNESSLIASFANTDFRTVEPLETTDDPPDSNLLMAIIEDVSENGVDSQYNGQTVTVSGTVVWKSEPGTGIVIYKDTHLDAAYEGSAIFFIFGKEQGDLLDQYTLENDYTFTVRIGSILPPKDGEEFYSIAGFLAE